MKKYIIIFTLWSYFPSLGQTTKILDSLNASLNELNSAKSALEIKILETERMLSEQTRLASKTLIGPNQVKAQCGVNECYIMKGPSYNADIITSVAQGTFIVISIDEKYNGYLKAEYGGSMGYVYSVLLDFPKETVKERTFTSPYTQSTSSNLSNRQHSVSPYWSQTIHTGPRGGKYYINKNERKTYVKKGK